MKNDSISESRNVLDFELATTERNVPKVVGGIVTVARPFAKTMIARVTRRQGQRSGRKPVSSAAAQLEIATFNTHAN